MTEPTPPNLGFAIHEIARLLRADYRRRVPDLGMTEAQWRALAYLGRMEGCRQAELAERLEVKPITLARLVDRLQAAGLVQRRPRADDRRAVQLVLTPKARPIVRRMVALGSRTRERALAGFEQHEREQLFAMLERIRDNLADGTAAQLRKGAGRGR